MILRHLQTSPTDRGPRKASLDVTIPETVLIEVGLGQSLSKVSYMRHHQQQVRCEPVEPGSLETILNKWLNMNLDKQKTGTFVPISALKWCVFEGKGSEEAFVRSERVHFDFFVASALNFVDDLCNFWLQKAANDGLLRGKRLLILLQKYSSVAEEAQWLMRVHWRKNTGFRIYKYKQLSYLNSIDTLNYHLLSEIYDHHISHLTVPQLDDEIHRIKKSTYGALNVQFYTRVNQDNL